MKSTKEIPENVFLVAKDTSVAKQTRNIDFALDRYAQIQLRCVGAAIQKGILIAESCVEAGFAQYSRFVSQKIQIEDRQVVCTIIKLKRPLKKNKKEVNLSKKNQKQPEQQKPTKQKKDAEDKQGPKYKQKNEKNFGYEDRSREPDRRQGYNQEHRQRNERREKQDYKEYNQRGNRDQRSQIRNVRDRKDNREYR